jgi:hypothetical protein
LIHRFSFGQRLVLGSALLLGNVTSACTLITDVNREDIPEPPPPVFPESDASVDASQPPLPEDGGADVGTATDAGDASPVDGGGDAQADAGGDAG